MFKILRHLVTDVDKFNIISTTESNPQYTLTEVASNFHVAPSSVHKISKKLKYPPISYKIILIDQINFMSKCNNVVITTMSF